LILACKQDDTELGLLLLSFLQDHGSRKAVISQMDSSCNTPLSLSSEKGCPALVKTLLTYDADPNCHSTTKIPLINAVKTKCISIMQHLISSNADINVQDINGDSALHHAVKTEKIDVVKLLLEAGANVNAVNALGQSPIHLAIQHSKRQINTSLRIEKALLNCGAHINAIDILG
jgi:ankyrin repeat protein